MITDQQVRRMMKLFQEGKAKAAAAHKAGMDEKTARKYLRLEKLPSELKVEHTWRTREDPFEEVWEKVRAYLEINPGLESKTLFEHLQRCSPGRFSDGQLRTLQRKVKVWRAFEGPPKEVFFEQVHRPGELSQSDFTSMNELGITIGGKPFDHLMYHFVLTYSNWETGNPCFSESFESLSFGLQGALWKLGGVPEAHRTDRFTACVQKPEHPEEFTQRYQALLRHYGLEGRKIQARKPHENGDVEQRHNRFKRALDQALMLRGSRDFASGKEYEVFLEKLFKQLNAGRKQRLAEELKVLRRLPTHKLPSCKRLRVRVSPGSTIRVDNNTYSVDSRLIGECVNVKMYAEQLEVRYAKKCVERIPRLRGEGKHKIQYRHIIDWLVRKPGAFENYRYRDELFPTSRFRMAYDRLKKQHTAQKAAKEYLRILEMAAKEGEGLVDDILKGILQLPIDVVAGDVEMFVESNKRHPRPQTEVKVTQPDLGAYDELLSLREVV